MPANTNNSLSDLNDNKDFKFNKMLNDTKIANSDSNPDKRELDSLKIKYQNAKDENEKNIIGEKSDTLNEKINKTINNGTTDYHNSELFERSDNKGNKLPTSLFDRDAYIDYGRFIADGGIIQSGWKEYNKDDKGNFTINNFSPINEPVLFKDSSLFSENSPEFSNEGLSIEKLIKWSEKYPALQLRSQDFVYCKKLGYYPNNRLIVLRRFKGGVPDNLFDYFKSDSSKLQYTQPLATMVTWLNPDEEIIDMTFNENWKTFNESFLNVIKNAKSNYTTSSKKSETPKEQKNREVSESYEDLGTALSLETLISKDSSFRKEDGVPYTRSDSGNPNLIHQAMKREIGGGGLSSEINFSLKFEYELRYNKKIDSSIALLDLISNAMRMGTSESEFKYNMPYLKESDIIKKLINGDMANFTDVFLEKLTQLTKDISQSVKEQLKNATNFLNNVKTSDIKNLANATFKNATTYIISKYRESLKAALSADTGLPSGIWHVTIGNPKAPIISCGDLIITESTLKLGKELGYNDFPNSFEITYKLSSARPRGRQELIRIMNSGRGRLYVYPTAKDNPDYDLY